MVDPISLTLGGLAGLAFGWYKTAYVHEGAKFNGKVEFNLKDYHISY